MAESRAEWEDRMEAKHGNVSKAQLDAWWNMKQRGERNASSGSSRGGGGGLPPAIPDRRPGQGVEFGTPPSVDVQSDGPEDLVGTYTGTRQELPDGTVRSSPAGEQTPDQPEPEPEEPSEESQQDGGRA